MQDFRVEHDSIGDIKVPKNAYWSAQTQRAIENFSISGLTSPLSFIYAIVQIKKAAAEVHKEMGQVQESDALAIIQAADEILVGKFSDQFVVDVYQAGAGTSVHMNVNEVIARRANELLQTKHIHPNDHVNMSQSTNDVIPTALRISILSQLSPLLTAITHLIEALKTKESEFVDIIKSGRTHLQDAMPVTLGQEFGAYAKAMLNDMARIENVTALLYRVGIGGSAVGSGVNTHPDYHQQMITQLARQTTLPLISSGNLFESMQNTTDFLDVSSSLRCLAQNLIRISNDLRLMSSGPQTGLAEIQLPAVQPGSSIMPGKINPSMLEMLTMVCFQVIGFDQAILLACQAGQLELNVMLPLIAYDLHEQIRLMTNAINACTEKCIKGIKADETMCRKWFEEGMGAAAILNPIIGYDKTADIVKEATEKYQSIKSVAVSKKYLTEEKAEMLFSIKSLTKRDT
jgi:fumarate hydratase class II